MDFRSFGEIYNSRDGGRSLSSCFVTTADLDGDGDQDIIVGRPYGKVSILENKMPQKNKK